MKLVRRVHLYLGCFFTPLLMMFLVTGFLLIWTGDRMKGPDEATSLLQRLFFVHTEQYLPADQPDLKIAQLKSIDPDQNAIFTFEPHGFPDQTPVRLTESGTLPEGIDAEKFYHTKTLSPSSFTLHAEPSAPAIELSGPADTNVYIMPKVELRAYNPKAFKLLIYLMVTGVVVTMLLGVVLAFKLTKDKRPVWAAIALGIIMPFLLLKLGQNQEPPEEPPPGPGDSGTEIPGPPGVGPGTGLPPLPPLPPPPGKPKQ